MHRLCLMVIALLVGVAVSDAVAQPATAGIVSSPCPPPDPAGEGRLKPIDDLFMTPAASPEALWAEFARLQAIIAGTNDVAGDTGPTTLEDYQHNILATAPRLSSELTLLRGEDPQLRGSDVGH